MINRLALTRAAGGRLYSPAEPSSIQALLVTSVQKIQKLVQA